MNKLFSQLLLGLVCIILGFMISFQLKLFNNPQSRLTARSFEDLAKEIDVLRKQRDDLSKRVVDLQDKIDEYEKSFASSSDMANQMKDELDNIRTLAGLRDVTGQGIIVKLIPPVDLTTNKPYDINPYVILNVVNELNASGAEAISINDERFVGRTAVREAGSYIKINGTPFSPNSTFVIKAIGDPKTLEPALKLIGGVADMLKEEYSITMEITREEELKILKYNKNIEFKHVKKAR